MTDRHGHFPHRQAAPPPAGVGLLSLDAEGLVALQRALHTHAILSATDLQGRLIYVSDRFCAILRQPREALIGRDFRRLLDPGTHAATLEAAWQTVRTGTVWKGDMRVLTGDASHCWFRTTAIALAGPDGQPVQCMAIHSDITELKRTEGALRDSEARTRLVLQAADVGLWDWNLLTNECYFSPEWKRQIGYAEDELPNTFESWQSHLHPQDEASTLAAVQDYREGRRPHYDVEFRMRHRDGGWRWIFARANFVRDAAGKPIRMLGSHTDITARHLANEALAASEERLHHALDATSDGVWDLNLTTGQVYFSPQWERLLGYEPGETPHRVAFFYSIVHPDDLPRVEQQMQAHLSGRTAVKQDEVRLRTKSGVYQWFLDRGKVVARDAAGTPLRMVGTITDITERHAIEAALLDSESKFRGIIHASPVPMALSDGDRRFSFVNPAFVKVLGYTLRELPLVDEWWARSYPDPVRLATTRSAWEAELHRSRSTGAPFDPMELQLHCRDGSSKTVLATASTFNRDDSTEYLVVLYDISAQKRAQAELSASLVEKEALLKEVHHRVKNNLQVITSLLRLEAMRSSQSGTRAVLGDMQGRIRSMALLHESLYRSGIYASVDLGDYLGQLVTQAFQSQARSGGTVRLSLALQPVRVGMDQATPCGLLVNELVSNCLKHGFPEGSAGEVRVELQHLPESRQIRLRVSDNGVGLPADFDAIRRQSLGLQLVEDLARQIGGQLLVEPGPAFEVVFPVEDVPAGADALVHNGPSLAPLPHG